MECQRDLFDLEPGEVFLSSCGRNPVPRSAAAAGGAEIARKAVAPHLVHHAGHASDVRERFAELVGGAAERVALLSSMSFAAALFARLVAGLAGRLVLVAQDEIDSLVLPFQGRCRGLVVVPSDQRYASAMLAAVAAHPGAAVALTPCFWTRGWTLDLAAVLAQCARGGNPVLIDVTQSCGAMPLDVSTFPAGLEFMLACSVHKHLMGIHGTCVALICDKWMELDNVEPLERHSKQMGNASGAWDLEENGMGPEGYPMEPIHTAGRFDTGLSNPVGWAILAESLRVLLGWKRSEQAALLSSLTKRAKNGLKDLPNVQVLGDCPHFFAIRLESLDQTKALHTKMWSERIRTDLRHSAIRVGVGVYNTPQDMDALVASVKNFCQA